MKYKKLLIIIGAVLFFLTALTFYLNRIIFPQLIKKIAIESIEDTLKRKVEINGIHFNWVKGFIIDKIKIYDKESPDSVFVQADKVSFGVVFIPGLKKHRITIPFINVYTPSVHLIRAAKDTWNFSDLLTPPKTERPSNIEVAWGGFTISNGKFLIDDISMPNKWSEYFDNINLKLSLSYKGISYDLTADIPAKKGFVGATVYYQPLNQNTQAKILLKNIDTASYLSLVEIPDVHIGSGFIKEINLNINYSKEKVSAQGDVSMENLDITSQDQSFKGDIQIHNLDAEYQNGDIKAQGKLDLNKAEITAPEIFISGNMQAKVDNFEYTQENLGLAASLNAHTLLISLKDRQIKVGSIDIDNIKAKKDKDGIHSVGSIITKGLFIQWPDQQIQGDITLKDLTMSIKDEKNISVKGQAQIDNLAATVNNISASASLKTDKFLFDLNEGIIKVSTDLNFSKGQFVMEGHKTIRASPQVELNLQMPLNSPQELTYKGSITMSGGQVQGFAPLQSLNNLEMDVDFQNDEATINALSVNVLDTNLRINGTVKNFKNPILNINAEANELNLSKIKELAPQLVDEYGLEFDGTTFVKVKFEGLAANPLAGKILAVASFKNVNAASSKLNQKVKNITGIIEATPDSLKWHDLTATYLDKKYSLAGTLDGFKTPRINATINGDGLHFEANLAKDNDTLTLRELTGKYLDVTFESKGTILLGKDPILDLHTNVSLSLAELIKHLPPEQSKSITPLNPTGTIKMTADIKGTAMNWKYYSLNAAITSPVITLMGYSLTDMKITIEQANGKVKNMVFDSKLYDGTVHAVGSLDLIAKTMPYELAFNIDNTDLRKFKMDSPLKSEEINGKFYFTTLARGTVADFKDNLQASGSMAIRDGFLAEFNLFKGLLSILNDVMRLGQVMITDVEANFTIEKQKISTENLRFKGPTIVLLGKGWVNFDQLCDLNITVDLSSGVVPAIAQDVLNSLEIRIYDQIANPKFKKKISVPQVLNTLLKNFLQ